MINLNLSGFKESKVIEVGSNTDQAKFKASLAKALTGDLTNLVRNKNRFSDAELSKLKHSKRSDWKSGQNIEVMSSIKNARSYMTHMTIKKAKITIDVTNYSVRVGEIFK